MKKLFALALCALMVLTMVGCSKKEEPAPAPSAPAPSAPAAKTTVTIWHTYTEGQQAYLEQAAADFNASQDLYEVVVESQVYSGFQDLVYQSVNAGKKGPDIIIDYASTAAKYVADNKVADLRNYLSPELVATLDAGALKEADSFADGGLHVFPIVFSGPVFFYNLAVYEELGLEVPTTWTQLAENSKKIKAAHPDMYGFAFDSDTDGAQTLIAQAGAEAFDVAAGACAFDTDAVKAQFQWYADGVAEGIFMAAPSGDYFSGDFNSGVLASYIGSVAGYPYLTAGTWGVAPLPQTEGGVAWTPAWNRGVIVFNYDDEARKAGAAAFTEYFASPAVNAGWCVQCNYQTALSGTREVAEYKDLLANSSTLNALQPETAGSFPAVTAITYVRTALANLMSQVETGTPVADAIATAQAFVAEELAAE